MRIWELVARNRQKLNQSVYPINYDELNRRTAPNGIVLNSITRIREIKWDSCREKWAEYVIIAVTSVLIETAK